MFVFLSVSLHLKLTLIHHGMVIFRPGQSSADTKVQHQQVFTLSWPENTAHCNARIGSPHSHRPGAASSPLGCARDLFVFSANRASPRNLSAVKIAELPFLRVHFVQERLDPSFIKVKITRNQNNCNPEPGCPTQRRIPLFQLLSALDICLPCIQAISSAFLVVTYLLFSCRPQQAF